MATLHLPARKRGSNTPGSPDARLNGWTRKEQRAQYLRAHPLCETCQAAGRVAEAVELDHRRPLSQGGTHDWDNLAGLCKSCHADKTRRELGQKPRGGCDENGMPTAPDHPWNK